MNEELKRARKAFDEIKYVGKIRRNDFLDKTTVEYKIRFIFRKRSEAEINSIFRIFLYYKHENVIS